MQANVLENVDSSAKLIIALSTFINDFSKSFLEISESNSAFTPIEANF